MTLAEGFMEESLKLIRPDCGPPACHRVEDSRFKYYLHNYNALVKIIQTRDTFIFNIT